MDKSLVMAACKGDASGSAAAAVGLVVAEGISGRVSWCSKEGILEYAAVCGTHGIDVDVEGAELCLRVPEHDCSVLVLDDTTTLLRCSLC